MTKKELKRRKAKRLLVAIEDNLHNIRTAIEWLKAESKWQPSEKNQALLSIVYTLRARGIIARDRAKRALKVDNFPSSLWGEIKPAKTDFFEMITGRPWKVDKSGSKTVTVKPKKLLARPRALRRA